MTNFFELMGIVSTQILESFILPMGISYWKFIIYMAFAAIVIVALVNKLPISMAGRSMAENASKNRQRQDKEED